MLWRAWRVSYQLRGFERRLAYCGRPRHFVTKPITLRSQARESQPSIAEPSIRDIAETKSDPPLYRAVQLFREAEAISVRSKHEDIKISGNIRSIRKQKNASFAHISDGSTLAPIQAVLTPELAAGLTTGTFVDIKGRWQASPAKGQSHEIVASAVKIRGPSDPETYPVQKKYQTNEYLRTIPHLRLRTSLTSLLIRARAQLLADVVHFCTSTAPFHSGLHVHPPLITSSDCEGAGEVFIVAPRGDGNNTVTSKKNEQHYFRDPKYLTVSSQLHLEAFSAELGNVWTLSPTFRAEQSDTPRHLSEFYMFEAELRGVESLHTVMVTVQNGIQMLTSKLRHSTAGVELLEYYANRPKQQDDGEIDLADRWTRLIVGGWEIISYTAAMAELAKAHQENPSLFQYAPTWTKGFQLEHEKWVVAYLGEGRPIFVTDYPKILKPFYMLPSQAGSEQDQGDVVACFDLLFPFDYCEIAGGSLREHRLENLIENMRQQGMLKRKAPSSSASEPIDTTPSPVLAYPFLEPGEDLGNLKWYADLRRYGSSPHGGFGVGFDRLLGYLTGVSNVRDVVPFPRTWGQAEC